MTLHGARGAGRIAGLDLIRGIAIGLVILHHAWPATFGSGGVVGVVAFFALSGYLITGILRGDLARVGRIRFGRFYRNRALRLLPALLGLVLGFLVVTFTLDPLDDRGRVVRSVAVALTYTADIPFDHGSPALSHLWTLAVEEQFYIVWPTLLAIAWTWRRTGALLTLTAGGVLGLCLVTVVLAAPDIYRVYTLPTSWAVVMVMGATVRIYRDALVGTLGKATGPISIGAIAALVALSLLPEAKSSPVTYLVMGPGVGIATLLLVLHWQQWRDLPAEALRPLLALGTISYAAYLWNYPIARWLSPEEDMSLLLALASILLTLLAAAASWWLLERRVAEWKAKVDAHSPAPEVETSVTDAARH